MATIVYFISCGLGPLVLLGINQFLLRRSLRTTSVITLFIYGATILNWIGLLVVAVVRRSVGCTTLIGECYAEGYYPDFDLLYMLVASSSLMMNLLSAILIVVICIKFVWTRIKDPKTLEDREKP